jgi:hypothetical protein
MNAVRRTLIAGIALALLLAGCGPGTTSEEPIGGETSTAELPPDQLYREATRNTLEATSFRIVGTASISIARQRFEVVFAGDDARGTQVATAPGIETTVEFVRAGDRLYILADEHYWQAYVNLEQLHLVINRWVSVPADHPDHSALLVIHDTDESQWEPMRELAREGDVLTDSAGNRFTVTTEGKPYLVRVEAMQQTEDGEATTDIAFSDFDAISETITPPSGNVLELG